MVLRLLSVVFFIGSCFAAARSPFDESLELQHQGKLKEAREVLLSAASVFRASSDQPNRARALSLASQVSLSMGDYHSAIDGALQAAGVREGIPTDTRVAEDFNTLGLANLYLGNYETALSNYQRALSLDRKYGSAEGEITRQNNIGNVYYFQGRYTEALRAYQAAMDKVTASTSEKWNPRRRELTLVNMATLYQRLGKEQTALEFYRQIAGAPQVISPGERAQFLLNQGVLYRRLGDPIKALQLYRHSRTLFASEHHPDGEIGALRNIGIALAVDLNDLAGALQAFTEALQLAVQSSNRRGIAQANLYRAQVLRRLQRLPEAETAARLALNAAEKSGLTEEQWKAEYDLGRIAEDRGQDAAGFYEKAIAEFESIRTGLARSSLRTEFLADKRDVYDSLIALQLRQSAPDVRRLFSWIERSRSRTFVERVAASAPVGEPTLAAVQSRLSPDTVLLDFWTGPKSSATLWITASQVGVVSQPELAETLRDALSRLLQSEDPSRSLGRQLLAGVPLLRHLIIVPDGPLNALPFEMLIEPNSGVPLIESHDVSYLPAAQFLLTAKPSGKWIAPWRRQLVAFGDPPVSTVDPFGVTEQWQPLPASADEVKGIASLLPGRSQLYIGSQARKHHLLSGAVAGVPLLHFSTHAIVDEENPDRSRVLLAPDSAGTSSDYLFEGEVYNLDLRGVDLATLSACDTARGKLIQGEGVEAFSRAFLAAGSSATITSLWRVPDRPTADFMKQLYYFLAQGQTKAEALRSAKLKFLHSNSALASPRYWAAFILNGDGWNPTRRVIPWTAIGGAVALVLALLMAVLRRSHGSASTAANGLIEPVVTSPANPNT